MRLSACKTTVGLSSPQSNQLSIERAECYRVQQETFQQRRVFISIAAREFIPGRVFHSRELIFSIPGNSRRRLIFGNLISFTPPPRPTHVETIRHKTGVNPAAARREADPASAIRDRQWRSDGQPSHALRVDPRVTPPSSPRITFIFGPSFSPFIPLSI